MRRNFKSRLIINIIVAFSIVLVPLLLIFFLGQDIKTQAGNIKSAKNEVETRIRQLDDLARLRKEAELARPNLVKLERLIPHRDELISLRRELEQLANRNGLTIIFSFGSENPKGEKLGSVNFELRLRGANSSIRNFMREIESNYSFIRIASLDIIGQGKESEAIFKGEVLFTK